MRLIMLTDPEVLKELVLKREVRFNYKAKEEYPEFQRSYDWLNRTLGYGNNPIWAWYQLDDSFEDYYKWLLTTSCKGEEVFLILNVPESEVTLSDFNAWHYVLNNWYLPEDVNSEEDLDGWSQEEIEESWIRVFNLHDTFIQATFPVLKAEYVKEIRFLNC